MSSDKMDHYVLILKEVFVIYLNSNCSNNSFNTTQEKPELVPIQITWICLSIVALILNLFSLFIFWHQPKSSTMRVTLILLSISETLFHSCMLLNYISVELLIVKYAIGETPTFWHLYITPRISAVTMVILHVFISARNWCNLIISMSRTEAVLYPMKCRRLFRQSRIYFIYFFTTAVAVVFSILRHLDVAMTICISTEYFVNSPNYFSVKVTAIFNIIYFILQTGIPWLSVITSTVIMIIVLSRFHSDRLLSNPVSQRNQKVAIRTVLLLAIIFSLCELPNLIVTFIYNLNSFINFEFINPEIVIKLGNTLVILDSIFNFFVYAASLPYFRRKLLDLFRCRLCLMSRNLSLIYENTWRSHTERSVRLNYSNVKCRPEFKHFDYQQCQKNSVNEILCEENFITQV